MPKLTMPKQPVRKDQEHEEEDRGEKAPVLLAGRGKGFLGRLGSAGRGYALAGAGVVAAAVVAVSLLSWLAPDSDRPIASPLEAVGRVAGEVIEQVDDQVEALLGTDDGENIVLRSVREGLAAAGSATPWLSGKSDGIDASPSSSTASPDSTPSSTDDAAAPSRGGESSSTSDGTPPSQPTSSQPSGPSETSISTDAPSPPTASEPAPPASEEPPVVEEPSSPPPAPEEPPAAEEPVPPSTEDPLPPVEGPPETSADE
jgi:hypothetical protein